MNNNDQYVVSVEPERQSARVTISDLVRVAVEETLAITKPDRLAYTEAEAAALVGVKPHVLRDCRRRGELVGCKVGAKIVYTREQLQTFLAKHRC